MAKALVIWFFCSASIIVTAQVEEIKSSSKENSKQSNKEGETDGEGSGWVIDLLIYSIPEWQSLKLTNYREKYPSMVSLDVMFQGAVKPSSYYILQPRIRGNWGLFSTDFRMSYLIEEDLEGYQHIRTSDWQVIQLNVVTYKFITARIGAGLMKEAFGESRSFNENSFFLSFHAPDQTKSLGFEYRFAKDWDTGANPRKEFSALLQYEIFSKGIFHGYASFGGVYQQYYNSITVWGIHAGIVFRLF